MTLSHQRSVDDYWQMNDTSHPCWTGDVGDGSQRAGPCRAESAKRRAHPWYNASQCDNRRIKTLPLWTACIERRPIYHYYYYYYYYYYRYIAISVGSAEYFRSKHRGSYGLRGDPLATPPPISSPSRPSHPIMPSELHGNT